MGETMNLDHMMSVSYSCLPTFLLNLDRVLVHILQHNEEVVPKTECHQHNANNSPQSVLKFHLFPDLVPDMIFLWVSLE